MNSPSPTTPSLAASLQAARAATQRREFERADALYREVVAGASDDADGLAEYGVFCLRTGRAAAACYLLSRALAIRPGDAGMLIQLGYARIELGDFEAARAALASALASHPDDAPALYGLALCHEHDGAWQEAASAYAQALARQAAPGDAFPTLLRLADASQRTGDIERARECHAQAARIAPDEPARWYAHACFLRETGDAAAAMALVDRCGQRTPDEPRILIEKARCLRLLGDPAQAMRWLDRLDKVAPGWPATQAERGHCLSAPADRAARHRHWLMAVDAWTKAGDHGSAHDLLERLLHEDPGSAPGWNARGTLENARHRPAEAADAWRTAIALDPAQLEAAANLALSLEGMNRLAEADAVAEAAAAYIDGGHRRAGVVELQLARARLARRRKDAVASLRHLARIDAFGPTDEQRRHAGFERGKLLDLQDDSAGAMQAFTLANRLALEPWQRAHPGRNKALAGVEYMLDLAAAGWMRQWPSLPAVPEHRRIAFLIGFPRSGTTLLNQVLDTHPGICAIEEKPTVQKMMDLVHGMPRGYPQALAVLDGIDVALLRQAYDRATASHGDSDDAKLLLDKFPMNTTLAGLLHRVFPQARFVFALRHPCDVVLSCFMQNFDLNNTMANFCTLADAVALYTRTMDLWQCYREQLPLAVHTIRYEDVVDDFDGQVRALCDFLDVPWQDGLRDFSRKALDRGRIDTPSYEQVSRPIYREARYRWERYRDVLEPFLPALRPYIERFGYADAVI